MAREIFISYSRKNLDVVKAIKSEIEKATGVECWMDLEGIESGAVRFTHDIVDGINSCRVFLFMLSNDSQSSKFALRELNYAAKKADADKQKHVVIVNIDDCQMCDEFDFMYGLTDTIVWNNLPQQQKLMRDLARWLEVKGEGHNNAEEKCLQNKMHSFGILILLDDGSSFVMNLIKRTDPLVTEKTLYVFVRANQSSIAFDFYQTDSVEDRVNIDECIHLGKKQLSIGETVPADTPVDLIFARTSDGSINVTVVCGGHRFTYNITSV